MYQSNRSFNILPPPPGIPQTFDTFSSPGGREFDHHSYWVRNVLASLDFMLRVVLIPRGLINHVGDKLRCIQRERLRTRGGFKTQTFVLYINILNCTYNVINSSIQYRRHLIRFIVVNCFDRPDVFMTILIHL